MANTNDPLGIAAKRIGQNAYLTSLGTSISGWTGDANGRNDLVLQQSDARDRVNLSSTTVGTAYAGFGIGGVST